MGLAKGPWFVFVCQYVAVNPNSDLFCRFHWEKFHNHCALLTLGAHAQRGLQYLVSVSVCLSVHLSGEGYSTWSVCRSVCLSVCLARVTVLGLCVCVC